jgi:hypothetical protein
MNLLSRSLLLYEILETFSSIAEKQTQVMFSLHQETQSTIVDEHAIETRAGTIEQARYYSRFIVLQIKG